MINYILEEICVENSLKNVEQNKFDLASLNYFTQTWISQILRISTIPGLELMVATIYLPTAPFAQYIRIWSAAFAVLPK